MSSGTIGSISPNLAANFSSQISGLQSRILDIQQIIAQALAEMRQVGEQLRGLTKPKAPTDGNDVFAEKKYMVALRTYNQRRNQLLDKLGKLNAKIEICHRQTRELEAEIERTQAQQQQNSASAARRRQLQLMQEQLRKQLESFQKDARKVLENLAGNDHRGGVSLLLMPTTVGAHTDTDGLADATVAGFALMPDDAQMQRSLSSRQIDSLDILPAGESLGAEHLQAIDTHEILGPVSGDRWDTFRNLYFNPALPNGIADASAWEAGARQLGMGSGEFALNVLGIPPDHPAVASLAADFNALLADQSLQYGANASAATDFGQALLAGYVLEHNGYGEHDFLLGSDQARWARALPPSLGQEAVLEAISAANPFAPEPGSVTATFAADLDGREQQAEDILRANGQWPPQDGHTYFIQIDQAEPPPSAAYAERDQFLDSFTGQAAAYRAELTANGWRMVELNPNGPWRSSAHPGQMETGLGGTPNADGKGKRDIAHLRSGVYEYKTNSSYVNGKVRYWPTQDSAMSVARDLNQDGVIDATEDEFAYENGLYGTGMQIHRGSSDTRTSSTGCTNIAASEFGEFDDIIKGSGAETFTYVLVKRPNDNHPDAYQFGVAEPLLDVAPTSAAFGLPAIEPDLLDLSRLALNATAGVTEPVDIPTVTLQRGATGEHVERLQTELAALGFAPGPIDGQFGPGTQAAVMQLQVANGLAIDGVVRPDTWQVMLSPDVKGPIERGKTVQEFLDWALAQAGDAYVYGAETNLNDPDPDTFDCSELVQWAAAQAGVDWVDGTMNQLPAVRRAGTTMTIEEALATPGALLYNRSEGHVAISLGDGRTIEARGRDYGVGIFEAGTRFDGGTGALLPGLDYSAGFNGNTGGSGGVDGTSGVGGGEVPANVPTSVLRSGSSGEDVRTLQTMLTGLGYELGSVDGQFGPRTQAAVRAFQLAKGLEIDGIVGQQTWQALFGEGESAPSGGGRSPHGPFPI